MPLWAIQLLVTVLVKLGLIGWSEKLAAKFAIKTIEVIKETKTYQDYDINKNNQKQPDTYMKSESNINKGE